MAITKVFLLSVPLEKDYAHTLYFANQAEQLSYFQGRIQKRYEDFTYQRKDGIIRVPDQIDTLWKLGANYVMYQNPDYNDKWFYAFITNMQYINDGRTDITIQTDCLQTWMFEKVVKPCFVEREHAVSDTVGENTLPEGLETGEYICEYSDQVTDLADAAYIVGVTDGRTLKEGTNDAYEWAPVQGRRYDGVFSGVAYACFYPTEINTMIEFINNYAKDGKGDSISCMFMYPAGLITRTEHPDGDGVYYILSSEKPKHITKNVGRNLEYSGDYKPRNKKLYSFPFQYLLVDNNNGGSAVYHLENFNGEQVTMEIYGAVTPGGSVRMIPKDYKIDGENNQEGLTLGKYPICNWVSDEYTNWLTQNAVNIGIELLSGVGQIVAGVAVTGATSGLAAGIGGGTVIGGVTQIAGTLGQVYQQSFASAQSKGNLNSGDVTTAHGINTFTFYQMRIKDEYLKIIDEYFDMYGYKTHRVKTPAEGHRENYWFTKTIDANITGAIPQDDLQTIKDCYNRGVTYWKNPENFKMYRDADGNPMPNGIV